MILYLASRFHSFPHAEVNNDPSGYETQHHLIADFTRLMQTTRQSQHFSSSRKKTKLQLLNKTKKKLLTRQLQLELNFASQVRLL